MQAIGPPHAWPPGPPAPGPPVDEVHVWAARLDSGSTDRWRLRDILARYLGEAPGSIELSFGERGKPGLARDPERLAFNLSHSGELALVAVADREVGVDVERVKPRRDFLALAGRALDPVATAAVREASPEQRMSVFYARWVEHEARLKCLGTGLAAAAVPDRPVAISPLEVGPGYAAAVAVAGSSQLPCRRYAWGRGA